MKKTLSHKGFTLIELLVVIAIIALLTAIVTSNFASSKAKSRDAKRVSDIAQLQLALTLYFDRCNDYPPIRGMLDLNSKSSNCNGDSGELNLPLSTYISVIPKDPINTGNYIYRYYANFSPGVATDYVLRAKLETLSSALSDDIDVSTFTLPCDDTSSNYYYCVRPN